MSELSLFPDAAGGGRAPAFEEGPLAPLAARMRPRTLDEFAGQEHVLGPGKALRELIEQDEPGSLILWGPPGSGKTTLARIIAERTQAEFVRFSAVTEGVPRVREIIREAATRLQATGRRTILFCDEIHRFNKAQQDAFLPHVEAGTVSLIGATTENPSFEVIGALLSRVRVFVLQPLEPQHLESILRRALADAQRGLGGRQLELESDALALLARQADGDARRALNALEAAAALVGTGGRITAAAAAEALQRRLPRYDKGGEEHYNLISALHKAVRGSDPQGALYWLARMLDAGEDPLYISRRLVRMAVEDIGLADPQALAVALACRDAYHFLGSPEGELALAEAAVYLATAPKSNRVYEAMSRAMEAARETPAEPVPLHVRNAPTRLMKELGYGRGYRYAFDAEEHYLPQEYLPERLSGRTFYEPSRFGYEQRIARRLAWWRELQERASAGHAGPELADRDAGGSANPSAAAPDRGPGAPPKPQPGREQE
ncbi:MAG: replication-associated recombination protein A [Gemmatimonadetes bacterium]|nr:replication-associated recombination protein A [Gemmatimonadota bacterium]